MAAKTEPGAAGQGGEGDDEAPATRRARPQRSLKMRAVDYLSRREHSRSELARKLARHAEMPDEVEGVIDDLARQGLLSQERFAQSVVHRKASRLGTSRIVQELRQHGVDAEAVANVRSELAATELTRARGVWARRYGRPPADAAERVKQMRFLAARGFAHDVIRQVVGKVRAPDDEFADDDLV